MTDREGRSKELAQKLGKIVAGLDLQTTVDALLLMLAFIGDEQCGDKRRYFFS